MDTRHKRVKFQGVVLRDDDIYLSSMRMIRRHFNKINTRDVFRPCQAFKMEHFVKIVNGC